MTIQAHVFNTLAWAVQDTPGMHDTIHPEGTMHICQAEYTHLEGMREFYHAIGVLPTSEVADIALIRSHVAYHLGSQKAMQAHIKASRGHSYRVSLYGLSTRPSDYQVVRIRDYYDHRNGVTGIVSVTV